MYQNGRKKVVFCIMRGYLVHELVVSRTAGDCFGAVQPIVFH